MEGSVVASFHLLERGFRHRDLTFDNLENDRRITLRVHLSICSGSGSGSGMVLSLVRHLSCEYFAYRVSSSGGVHFIRDLHA